MCNISAIKDSNAYQTKEKSFLDEMVVPLDNCGSTKRRIIISTKYQTCIIHHSKMIITVIVVTLLDNFFY